jgi:zinc transporter ZupT
MISLAATVLLAASFVLGGRLKIGLERHRRRWLSFGAGIATAYVFVHLLPELSRVQEIFFKATADRGLPFPESRVYTSALAGFILMYGLEHLVSWSRKRQEGETEGEEEGNLVSWAHVGGFSLYSALVSYTMARESERGIPFLIFYLVAMSLHFLGTDHALRREYARWYDSRGKWILAG